MRLVLVGLPASGKTFLSRQLAERLGRPVLRVDDQRRLVGDGTVAGEYSARAGFLRACALLDDVIIETAGLGAHRVALRQALASRPAPVCVATVWCEESLRVERLMARHVHVPHPDWGLPPTWGVERQTATLRKDFIDGFWSYRPDWRHIEVRGDEDVEDAIGRLVGFLDAAAQRACPDPTQAQCARALRVGWQGLVPVETRAPGQALRPTFERSWELVTPECDAVDLERAARELTAPDRRIVTAPSGPDSWVLVAVESEGHPRVTVRLPMRRATHPIDWMARFVERMERAATSRGASDAWAWFSESTEALDALMRGWWSAKTGTEVTWGSPLPPVRGGLPEPLRKRFRDVASGLDLASSHEDAERLLSFAESLAEDVTDRSAASFLESWLPALRWAVFVRDGLWNFRDVARHARGALRSGVLFRGSSPTRYSDSDSGQVLISWLDATLVRAAVDLRTRDELEKHPYAAPWRDRLERRHTPFDGASQLSTPLADGTTGYVRMFEQNRHAIREALTFLAGHEHPLLVHCHAGMDRTGVVVAVVGHLCSVPRESLLCDYLASGGTTAPPRMEDLLSHLEGIGGPASVARHLDLAEGVLDKLRSRLMLGPAL